MRRLGILALLVVVPGGAADVACRAVEGDRIRAGDLAAVQSEFGAIPADTPFGFVPPPGTSRMYRVAELERMATRYGIRLNHAEDVCFERATETLQAGQLIAAMHAVAGFGEARIEIVEFSRTPVPRGEIRFEAAGPNADLWRGQVVTPEGGKSAIWARVRMSLRRTRVVAREALPVGKPIGEAQVRLEIYEGPAVAGSDAEALDQVVGRIPRRSIAAGAPVSLRAIQEPNDIARGDMVDVEARSGGARVLMTGQAESSGRRGDKISVRNPKSGRTFTALVEGKGRATVVTSAGGVMQ